MDANEALEHIGKLVSAQTGKPLDNLQRFLISKLWQQPKLKYLEIAIESGYSEAHVKDVAYQLWQILSKTLGEKVSKSNFRSLIEEYGRSQSSPTTHALPPQEPDSSQQAPVDLDFVGREGAIADIDELVNRGKKVILIHQRGGEGKTTLAKQYLKRQFGDKVLEFRIAKEAKDITSAESLLEERLRQMGEEPGREFGVSLDRLKQKLKSERMGILIDNLETALDENGRFIEPHRRYVELLLVLCDPDVLSVTLITSRDLLCEPSVQIKLYRPQGLDLSAWQRFFQSQGTKVEEDSSILATIHKAYGGNAKAMTLIRGAVQEDFEGNIDAYWRDIDGDLLVSGELRNLVDEQFDRLQRLNPIAYLLLIRMSCYRYQDVPNVPKEGLACLLWDLDKEQHQQIFRSLKNRALVEFKDRKYWLHPEIRAEAIKRLRASTDWENTNRKAALFWQNAVEKFEVLEDAIKAFEAYYHYQSIGDINQAARVILRTCNSRWESDECLGRAFYRLGLLEKMIVAINSVIQEVDLGVDLGKLNNILGDLYWLAGSAHKAIRTHKRAEEIAVSLKRFRLEIASLLNMGLCKINLYEIEEAIVFFRKAETLSTKHKEEDYTIDSWFCLAYLYSEVGSWKVAKDFAEKVYRNLEITEISFWSTGYSRIFLASAYKNLREYERSYEMYQQALAFSEVTHYSQVKAKALIGLAELYRIEGKLKLSESSYLLGVEILEKIGAKSDLAEAYFQLGLTYKKIGDSKKCRACAAEAIQLYENMQAPRQVERVQQAIKT